MIDRNPLSEGNLHQPLSQRDPLHTALLPINIMDLMVLLHPKMPLIALLPLPVTNNTLFPALRKTKDTKVSPITPMSVW